METNKFLKKYPQLWIPKAGDVVKIINVHKKSLCIPYHTVGKTCIITEKKHGLYSGKFKLTAEEQWTWKGICTIGLPYINFVLYTNE